MPTANPVGIRGDNNLGSGARSISARPLAAKVEDKSPGAFPSPTINANWKLVGYGGPARLARGRHYWRTNYSL